MEKAVWVLGSEHPNAHNCISWQSPFPNFANCDVLIVNLESLTEKQYNGILSDLHEKAQKYIFDLLMTGEKEVIVLLSPNQDFNTWLPLHPIFKETAPVEIELYSSKVPHNDYLEMVENCPFYIHGFTGNYFRRKVDPRSVEHENFFFTNNAKDYGYDDGIRVGSVILNKAKQKIGCTASFVVKYGIELEHRFESGHILFLPPPTKVGADEALGLIVNVVTGSELIESPPDWEKDIEMPDLRSVEDEIEKKEKQKEIIIEEIGTLKNGRDELTRFRRLLWTKGPPLEEAVKEAFVFLEFAEIGKVRDANMEDWVIQFQNAPDFEYGILEVEGSDKRTSLSDLTQCNKWVEDYMVGGIGESKGIFVPNQHRLGDFRENKTEREHFEDNELDYVKTRGICILPSCEIFEAVLEKMKGRSAVTRESIESKILASNGVCNLI